MGCQALPPMHNVPLPSPRNMLASGPGTPETLLTWDAQGWPHLNPRPPPPAGGASQNDPCPLPLQEAGWEPPAALRDGSAPRPALGPDAVCQPRALGSLSVGTRPCADPGAPQASPPTGPSHLLLPTPALSQTLPLHRDRLCHASLSQATFPWFGVPTLVRGHLGPGHSLGEAVS